MNWNRLVVPITRVEIAKYVDDLEWQQFRLELLGTTLSKRFKMLEQWLYDHDFDRASRVQVANYVSALRRTGLIE